MLQCAASASTHASASLTAGGDCLAAWLQGGRMTQVMEALKVGDSMEVKGPLGHFIYQGRGKFKHSGKAGTCRQLSMIAGGTGITPMWQVIQVRV